MSRRRALRRRALAGGAGGLVAGAATAVLASAESARLGLGCWTPAKSVAAAVLGLPALVGDGATVSIGLALHLAVSVVCGVGLGLGLPRRSGPAGAAVAGLLWGTALWALGWTVVLPALDPVLLERVRLVPWRWFVAHLVFGAVAGTTAGGLGRLYALPPRRAARRPPAERIRRRVGISGA